MSKIDDLFVTTLKDNGHSNTFVRRKIFEVLGRHDSLTSTDICRELGSQADRASVYRTISLFERLGIVKRVYVGWKYFLELTEKFSDHHHHLVCISCQRVISIQPDSRLEQLIHDISQENALEPSSHQMEIQGVCSNCQKTSGNKKTPAMSQGQRKPHTSYLKY